MNLSDHYISDQNVLYLENSTFRQLKKEKMIRNIFQKWLSLGRELFKQSLKIEHRSDKEINHFFD